MRCVTSSLVLILVSFLLVSAIASSSPGDDGSGNLTFRTSGPTLPQQPPAQQASTPAPVFPRVGAGSLSYAQSYSDPQATNQTRQALAFYGGNAARATLSQLPRRTPIQHSAPRPTRRPAKPFETIHHEPTVSPYLNLYREEEELESAPNYFAFVRPQMEQLDANRAQQREIQQLRGQLNGVSSTISTPTYDMPGGQSGGTAARYMDTAQFYGSWRR
jgi:hypothetical protein